MVPRALTATICGLLYASALVAQGDSMAAGPGAPIFRCDTAATVDRVVAVVGDAPILASQVEEEIFTSRSQQGEIPKTQVEFRALCHTVISDLVDAEVMVQAAQRDTSIKVTDQEIAEGVDQQYKNVRQRFTSEIDFRAELARSGFQTPEEFRRWLSDSQRKAALRNRLTEKLRGENKLKPVQPTEKEMRAYFDEYKGQLPQRPATISFRNIVIAPKPTAEGAGAGQGTRGLAGARAAQGGGVHHRRQALLSGPGQQGTGWRSRLVPSGTDGPGV